MSRAWPTPDLDSRYIRVELARPGSAGRRGPDPHHQDLKDPKSYFSDGKAIVFDRPLGIKRNSVVLPPGYELVSCNIPSQVIEEADGRVGISFMNTYPAQAPLVIRASALEQCAHNRPRPKPSASSAARAATPGDPSPPLPPMERVRISERAFQDREIVYFLKSPETHAFSLYHDYTETREGIDKYVNVVRAGSTVSEPSAKILDTGDVLKTETLKGAGDHRRQGGHR